MQKVTTHIPYSVAVLLVTQLAAAGTWLLIVANINPSVTAAIIGVCGQVLAALLTFFLVTRSRKSGDK